MKKESIRWKCQPLICRAVRTQLTQKPHDICVVELFHAGRLSEKILHLWASADGNWWWDRAQRKKTWIICRWTKSKRCCLNFEVVASLVLLPCWYGTTWNLQKSSVFQTIWIGFMELTWPWNDTPLQWTLYVPIFHTSTVFISSLNKKRNYWPYNLWTSDPREEGLTLCETACVSKYEGTHCHNLGCLLTLHRLDGDFEDGFLLSQQPLHHWAKFSWRNKLKHKHVLDATLTKCLIQQQQQQQLNIHQLTKCS